jgi:isoquinoline 1-oxidoreductase beta subunit
VQTRFKDFPVLRLADMPEVDVHVIPGGETPSGMGEPPVPLVIPAVLNAVFAATGVRVRRVPLLPGTLPRA